MHVNNRESDQADPVQLDPSTITRPDDALLVYYFIISLLAVVAFPIVFVPLFIRFKTMRYRFDDSGVSMCWGFFFRREIYLTYGRLQDIHLTRNILERWMGLAKLPIQTASGSSGATMRIEGIRDPEPLRDFLYSKMRGAKGATDTEGAATELLRDIRDELRGLRADSEAAK
jgi:putative membrane protein